MDVKFSHSKHWNKLLWIYFKLSMVTGVDCGEKAGKDYVAHKQL